MDLFSRADYADERMSRIDEELARALATPSPPSTGLPSTDGSHHPPVQEPAVRDATPSRVTAARRPIGLLVGLVVVVVAISTLILTGMKEAAVYSKGVDELIRERARIGSRPVRVLGILVPGSLRRRDDPCEYRFRLRRGDAILDVHYPECLLPDTFRDVPGVTVEATVEGRLTPEGYLAAYQIMAKCPSKYDMKERQSEGTSAPHLTETAGPSGNP